MNKIITIFAIITFPVILLAGGMDTVRTNSQFVNAIKLNENITIDGKLNEAVWQNGHAVSHFIQRNPDEGEPATEKTEVRIAFDEEAIYIGARLYDSSPDSIIARLSRRDNMITADMFGVYFDPYLDKRSGYFFSLNAAGTRFDGVLYNDDWSDDSWDGVWEGKVDRNDEGWTAEMKIPFSQLRFHSAEEMTWGINFKRDIARRNENDYMVFVPKNESGFVSHFSELKGLDNIKPSKQIEVLPYVTSKAEYLSREDGNPFRTGSQYSPDVGVDLKMGLGSNLSLNATVNPDFGQVEIDPAVINLSDVETYFSEKRPFFIEGSSIFNFGRGGSRSYWSFNWGNPNFFYSRRIGRTPSGSVTDADYVNYPDGTHILGAAKITGKLGSNWNVGIVQAVTNREFAEIKYNGNRSEVEVEPLTYYGIARAQKDFDEGFQGLGFIATGTNRFFKDNRLRNEINKNAFSFGLDGWTFLDSSRTWVFTGWGGMSHITGSNERLLNLKQNSRHYFQRPDASHVKLDSNATSLTGFAGRFMLNKQKGNSFFNAAIGAIDPRFDVNDLGFMWRTDLINMHVAGGYKWKDPTDYYRYVQLTAAAFRSYDFAGNIIWEGLFTNGYYEFLNYYGVFWNAAYNPETVNIFRTRGGPKTLNTPGYQFGINGNTDNREDIIFELGYYTYRQSHSYSYNIDAGITYRPATNFSISVSPFYSNDMENTQWVTSVSDPLATETYGRRYIFGELDQTTIGAGIRLNWIFTPNLSLQLYAQPLIASGNYSRFKELARTSSYDFNVYGEGNSTFNEETMTADPDGSGPADEIIIDNPDFNFISLRGNAVLRWEYLPGSVLYFVWTQTRSDVESIGDFQFGKSFNRILDITPDNIFMIKATYWFNI